MGRTFRPGCPCPPPYPPGCVGPGELPSDKNERILRIKSSVEDMDILIENYNFEYNDVLGKYFITRRHSDKAVLMINKWNREVVATHASDMKALELVYRLTTDGLLTNLTPEEEAELEPDEPTTPENPDGGEENPPTTPGEDTNEGA